MWGLMRYAIVALNTQTVCGSVATGTARTALALQASEELF
jgi:hypothetical protein